MPKICHPICFLISFSIDMMDFSSLEFSKNNLDIFYYMLNLLWRVPFLNDEFVTNKLSHLIMTFSILSYSAISKSFHNPFNSTIWIGQVPRLKVYYLIELPLLYIMIASIVADLNLTEPLKLSLKKLLNGSREYIRISLLWIEFVKIFYVRKFLY